MLKDKLETNYRDPQLYFKTKINLQTTLRFKIKKVTSVFLLYLFSTLWCEDDMEMCFRSVYFYSKIRYFNFQLRNEQFCWGAKVFMKYDLSHTSYEISWIVLISLLCMNSCFRSYSFLWGWKVFLLCGLAVLTDQWIIHLPLKDVLVSLRERFLK